MHTAICAFQDRTRAEEALAALARAGFDRDDLHMEFQSASPGRKSAPATAGAGVIDATNRAIIIADMAGVPLYVVHTSCEQAHEAIRRARQNGMRVYGEPLIQHLTLDEGEYFDKDWDHAARRVMSPPFRNKQHQDSLWAGLASGSLQVVATDHCAFTTEQKRTGLGDFPKVPNRPGRLGDPAPHPQTTPCRPSSRQRPCCEARSKGGPARLPPSRSARAAGRRRALRHRAVRPQRCAARRLQRPSSG